MSPSMIALVLFVAGIAAGKEAAATPEAGPESGSLRMRLEIRPQEAQAKGENRYDVTVAITNVAKTPITLQAEWMYEGDEGGLADYIAAAISIEAFPPQAPWIGGVRAPDRTKPQPEQTLPPGETLTVTWAAVDRRLKKAVTDPNLVQNPEFKAPGLYAIHATLAAKTSEGVALLRSNEQLVSFGGSRVMPKHGYGSLWAGDASTRAATLSLGSLQQVKAGDVFAVRTTKTQEWLLMIDHVEPTWSRGALRIAPGTSAQGVEAEPKFPEPGMNATLVEAG
jgi:hypothetical protein